MNIREHSRLQLEATKLGRNVVFQVTIFERKDRPKSRLYAETQCDDPLQHIIQFVIRDAPDVATVVEMFTHQLLYRGFVPLRYRLRTENGGWEAWRPMDEGAGPTYGP